MRAEGTPQALLLFTDREGERQLLADYFMALSRLSAPPQKVLSFYGVGGRGKSTLLAKAVHNFQASAASDIHTVSDALTIASVDLDEDRIDRTLPAAEFLFRIRNALKRAGVTTPLFDYVYLTYLNEELPGQLSTLQDNCPLKWAGSALDSYDLIHDLASVVGKEIVQSLPGMRSVLALWPKLHKWFEDSQAQRRFGGKPENWSQSERLDRMPPILADDLLARREHNPNGGICVIIDGFERIQSTEHLNDAQKGLQRLIAACKGQTGIGWVIVGREKLRWCELYNEPYETDTWDRRIKSCLLDGLAESDSRDYLTTRANWERNLRDPARPEVATLIEQLIDPILDGACEHHTDHATPRSFLPYFLDLAIALIATLGKDFTPEVLGVAPNEMELRFLGTLRRYNPKLVEAMEVLSLALSFDQELFVSMVQEHFLPDLKRQDFHRLVGGDYCFVIEDSDNPGRYRFHRHMQACLLRTQLDRPEDKKAAQEVIEWLLKRYAKQADLEAPV
ncbi:hypothetical protein [Pseudomonas fluorescens]|uniref:hypothetical protein n=1 Tax=Pseudomonas fluorescens TaxID=294 RepID=UPI001242FD8A|nr:hypothetical protein [Pseudomonas fluorescens]VVM51353.1 hypothetical protein PS639_00798 [Pseudomonas fluorescens]